MSSHADLKIEDFFNGKAEKYVRGRLLDSDAGIENGKYDSFGLDIDTAGKTFTVFLFFYKFYFRVDVHGVGNIPSDGSGLIISNHAPILPFDAAMLTTAALVEPEKPRFVRTIVNRSLSKYPYFSTLLYRNGQIIGCDENVKRIFENENLVLIFPTGAEGEVHSIFDKYHVGEFTAGFMEYAMKYKSPIIPTCVTGSEEANMTLGGIDLPFAGFKHFPISPLFPWLGLLGLLPFPSKFDIYHEPAMDFSEHAKDADKPDVVHELSDKVHDKVQDMLDEALGRK